MNKKEYQAAWYKKNRAKVLARVKEYNKIHAKDYYKKTKDHQIKKSIKWSLENKSKRSVTRKEHYKIHKEELKEYHNIINKKYRDKDPCRFLLKRVKASAKTKGIEFNLEKEDIVIPELCPILLIPLKFNIGQAGNDSISVDRIDTTKGYIKGNIAVISRKANTMKSNMTLEQIDRLHKYVSGH